MPTLKQLSLALVASVIVTVVMTDYADARRGGGGGFRAGGGMRGGGIGMRGGFGGNRAHISHPIVRPGFGRPSHPIAGRPGWGYRPGHPIAGRPGWGYRPGYPGYGYGWGWGAAAIGAGLAYPYYYNDDYYTGSIPSNDGVAMCAQRFRSFDPATGTYVRKGGQRVRCPYL